MTEIVRGYIPGVIGRITGLHARYYSQHWGFGLFFESKVATQVAEFMNRYDEERDGMWIVLVDGEIVGSIAIDGINARKNGAHLRWFIVAPEHQGGGIGKTLIGEATDFCRRAGYRRVYLWTFAGLDAARHLYETWGFRLVEEFDGDQWGRLVREQRFELSL